MYPECFKLGGIQHLRECVVEFHNGIVPQLISLMTWLVSRLTFEAVILGCDLFCDRRSLHFLLDLTN